MKKLFAILAAAVMVVVCASSCNKVAKTLEGTEWVATISEAPEDIVITVSVLKEAKINVKMTSGSYSVEIPGTYAYTFPNVSASLRYDGYDIVFTGTVSSDYKTMTLSGDGDTFVFTRSK